MKEERRMKTNFYELNLGREYKFKATVGNCVTDVIYPKHSGPKTPDYWYQERIILNNVMIFNGSEYVDFEPTIKIDFDKQFIVTREHDIVTFYAYVDLVDTSYKSYDEDDRGNFLLEISKATKFGNIKTIQKIKGTKDELEEIIEQNQDFFNKDNIYHTITCYQVRRLIKPSYLKIVAKAQTIAIA